MDRERRNPNLGVEFYGQGIDNVAVDWKRLRRIHLPSIKADTANPENEIRIQNPSPTLDFHLPFLHV